MKTKLHGGVDGGASEDDGDEEDEEDGDHDVGDDLERLAGHGAILMDVGVHRFVAVVHGAQLVLDLVVFSSCLCGFGWLFFLDGLGLLDLRLGLFGFWLLGLGLGLLKRRAQIGATIWAETDAAGQVLAAVVAKSGTLIVDGVDAGGVAIGGVGVVSNDKLAALVPAHSQTLRTHDLAVVYHHLFL